MRKNAAVMEPELELLITVVVEAADERSARSACQDFVRRIGGRVVGCGDCSDEDPGCWSVMIRKPCPPAGDRVASLSRSVQDFLRGLGPDYARHRVCCEPPTAWTVLEHPELVGRLVAGAERILVESWSVHRSSPASGGSSGHGGPERLEPDAGVSRLRLRVDVVTGQRAAAERAARALAGRLSSAVSVLAAEEQPPVVRVLLDLGASPGGQPQEAVSRAVRALGGSGWSRVQTGPEGAWARWLAAPLPPSGVAAVEVAVTPTEGSTLETARPL